MPDEEDAGTTPDRPTGLRSAKNGRVAILMLAHASTAPFPAREEIEASRRAKRSIQQATQ